MSPEALNALALTMLNVQHRLGEMDFKTPERTFTILLPPSYTGAVWTCPVTTTKWCAARSSTVPPNCFDVVPTRFMHAIRHDGQQSFASNVQRAVTILREDLIYGFADYAALRFCLAQERMDRLPDKRDGGFHLQRTWTVSLNTTNVQLSDDMLQAVKDGVGTVLTYSAPHGTDYTAHIQWIADDYWLKPCLVSCYPYQTFPLTRALLARLAPATRRSAKW